MVAEDFASVPGTNEPMITESQFAGFFSGGRDVALMDESRTAITERTRSVDSILDVVGALVLVLDDKGLVTLFNGASQRLSGYDSAEIVGRTVWDALVPPAEAEDVRAAVTALLAGTFPNSHENHWLTRTGELRLIAMAEHMSHQR